MSYSVVMNADITKLTYQTINEKGEVVEVDMASGLPVESKKHYILDSEIKPRYQLSPAIIDIICKLIREGNTYRKIALMPGMPPVSLMLRWKRESEELRTALQEAEKDRAEIFHSRIVDLAEQGLQSLQKDEVPAYKLQIDVLKYLAEADNPDKYKPKPGSENLGSGSVVIQVNTGINRDSPADTVEASFTEVQSGQEASIPGEATEVSREEHASGSGTDSTQQGNS